MTPLERLRAEMSARSIEAMLLSHPQNIGWLTGFTGSFSRVVVTPTGGYFVTDSRYTLQAEEQVQGLTVESFQSPVTGDDYLAKKLSASGTKRIGFESGTTTHASYQRLAKKFAETELVPVEDIVEGLRKIKSAAEIEAIRNACQLADAGFDHIQRMLRPGITEFDVALDLEFFFRRHGATLAFDSIVVSGERSARPHGKPSEKKLEIGDFVTLDFGACLNGYNSDITRTVVIGEASDRHREIYGQVLKAQLAALDAIKPGVAASAIDKLSRDILNELDLAKYFGHGLGHGLGRDVHDGGRLGPGSEDIMTPGQVWTVEPGVYLPGFGGVRIEDDVVVTETGIEILTKSTKELLVMPGA